MSTLVTGGAGYIGSHVVKALRERGEKLVVVDDLSSGQRARVANLPFFELDIAQASAPGDLERIMREHRVDSIVHLAARKRVDESVARPEWYHEQNVGGLANLLDAAANVGVDRMVFSSTAAVYATSNRPVKEDDAAAPANPYGQTKLDGERLLEGFAEETEARSVSLRYFNVAGAAVPQLGDPGSYNLVPMVFDRIEAGLPPRIFGDDYDTPDGTAVRDYVHVQDLAEAHLVALDGLDATSEHHRIYNIGTGVGSSVRTMVNVMLHLAESELQPVIEPRRLGDPAEVVSDVGRVRNELGWSARFTVEEILESAWRARRSRHP